VLILIGLRASGKTTLGKLLAEHTGRPFTDLDDLTAAGLGCGTASEALRVHGAEAFRAAELEALRRFFPTAQRDHILALGGGTPTIPDAAAMLRPHTLIYLRAQPRTLQERLRADSRARPSLTGGDAVEEVPAIFAQRDALYRSLAGHIVDTDTMIAENVLAALNQLDC
jgi:shikimate kinase